MMKASKILLWLAAGACTAYGIKRYKFHKGKAEEAERETERRLKESGLTLEDADNIIRNSDKPAMMKLVELLRKSVIWDLSDSWNGRDSYIKDNMILVSQERSKTGRLDWTVKIKMPAFKPNTPITPDYIEQIEEFIKEDVGFLGYQIRKKYFGLYTNPDQTNEGSDGTKTSNLYCFPIIPSDLDSFKNLDGSGNGLEIMFKLLRSGNFEELEEKFGVRDDMFIQDIEMYLEITIPVADEKTPGLDLIGIQNFLRNLMGLRITNSRSGGRFAQDLGPVAFCSDVNDPRKEVTSFLVWSKELSAFKVKNLVVKISDEEENDEE